MGRKMQGITLVLSCCTLNARLSSLQEPEHGLSVQATWTVSPARFWAGGKEALYLLGNCMMNTEQHAVLA